ncbi:MAG TPA: malto-oligosyltrehalose synthase [Humisphaera sp.]
MSTHTPPSVASAADELLKLALDRVRTRRRLPESTYRLQFHKGFTFRDATAAVPYLSALGLTHAYASPYMKARPGSTHGYDVIDHNQLNPELGTQADYDALVAALSARGLGHILDTVPNHAGVGTNDNAWWNDVLEHGRASRYADCFDITWDGSPRPALHGKVLLPVLGSPYAQVLEKGELELSFDLAVGTFAVEYYDRRFPVDPRTYTLILRQGRDELGKAIGSGHAELLEYDAIAAAAEALPKAAESASARAEAVVAMNRRLADLVRRNSTVREHVERVVRTLNGTPGSPASFDALDELLVAQNYRLAYWRVAPDEINYRRFFDVNDLAALAMERPAVFEAAHDLTLRLVAEGKVDGLRIDHPDGLYDPPAYLARLQRHAVLAHARAILAERQTADPGLVLAEVKRRLEAGTAYVGVGPGNSPLPVWGEKILALSEPLIEDWALLGTSGYDFLNMTAGLFVDPSAEPAVTAAYAELTGAATDFHRLVYEKKKLILARSLASELRMLAHRLDWLAQGHRSSRDFTQAALTEALREVIACFPVYRSYVTEAGASDVDAERIDRAVDAALKRNPTAEASAFRFVRDALLLKIPQAATPEGRAAYAAFAGKFQQLTSPATAKGIEDTAFYIYNRFVALNEVGNEPDRFGLPPDEVHAYYADRQHHWPHALSTLSTHDTKRSEDVRARLYALSEMPDEWRRVAGRWFELNAKHRKAVDGKPAPDANEEYLLYQTLLGVWPFEATDVGPHQVLDRVRAYMLKAMREAKVNTSWTDQNEPHEQAVTTYIGAVLDEQANAPFLAEFLPVQRRVAWFGMINSLSQTLLKLTAPGVPDTYQGTELWDLSLVDPDNRRPVDYARRRELLAGLEARFAADDLKPLVAELLASPTEGRVKLYTTWLGLDARRRHPGLFSKGSYTPIRATGAKADHAFAFAREHAKAAAVVVVPRLAMRLGVKEDEWPTDDVWGDTALPLPAELAGRRLRNVYTGETVTAEGRMAVAEALATFPVGLWIAE